MDHGGRRCSGNGRRGGDGPGRQVIARGSFVLAERCSCGAVHLSVGPVCLRLDPAALPELAQVIHEAFEVLLTISPPVPGEVAGDDGEEGEQPGGDRVSEQSPPTKLN